MCNCGSGMFSAEKGLGLSKASELVGARLLASSGCRSECSSGFGCVYSAFASLIYNLVRPGRIIVFTIPRAASEGVRIHRTGRQIVPATRLSGVYRPLMSGDDLIERFVHVAL